MAATASMEAIDFGGVLRGGDEDFLPTHFQEMEGIQHCFGLLVPVLRNQQSNSNRSATNLGCTKFASMRPDGFDFLAIASTRTTRVW